MARGERSHIEASLSGRCGCGGIGRVPEASGLGGDHAALDVTHRSGATFALTIGLGASGWAAVGGRRVHVKRARAVAGRDASRPLVLLAHQPKAVHEAVRHGVDLQLSGHTHGGQIWPLGWLQRVGQPAVAGLAKFSDTFLYVSCGTGSSGPPMRLVAPAEITQITLRVA